MNLSRDHRPSGRERAEDVERATVSMWAVPACESKGRERPESPDAYRTAFQVDRDRVLRSRAFGRLAETTVGVPAHRHPNRMQQVTRVAALSGWVSRSLRLNADLAEAVAYASVLGAPPFGVAGQDAITSLVGQPFLVGEQSLRVVERLEGDRAGLNLTWEVRDGIVHASWEQTPAATCEGQVVRLVTRVVELVDAWVALGRPELAPSAQRELGTEPGTITGALLGDVLAASGECPEVLSGELVDRYLPAIVDAVERAREEPEGVREHERALHVVSSLVVYEAERTAAVDLRGAVDLVCSWSNTQALAAFRERFQPAG